MPAPSVTVASPDDVLIKYLAHFQPSPVDEVHMFDTEYFYSPPELLRRAGSFGDRCNKSRNLPGWRDHVRKSAWPTGRSSGPSSDRVPKGA